MNGEMTSSGWKKRRSPWLLIRHDRTVGKNLEVGLDLVWRIGREIPGWNLPLPCGRV